MSELLKKISGIEWVGLLAVLLMGTVLRAYNLGHESFWWDEIWTAKAVSLPTATATWHRMAADFHPPLYYVFAHYWARLGGVGDAWLRLPSAIAGVLTIPAVAAVAWQLFDKRTAWVAALFIATAPYAVELSREARGNSFFLLFSMWATAWLLSIRKRRDSVIYAVLMAAMVYTHVFGWFVWLAHGIWAAVEVRGDSGRTRKVVWAWLSTPAAFVVWLPMQWSQFQRFSKSPWYDMPAPDVIGWLIPEISGGPGIAAVLGIGVVVGLASRLGDSRGLTLTLAAIAGIILVPQAVSVIIGPVLRPRNVIPMIGVICAVSAAGCTALRPPLSWLAASVVAGQMTLATIQLNHGTPRKTQYREAAAHVNDHARLGDLVVVPYRDMWKHYLHSGIHVIDHVEAWPTEASRVWVLQHQEGTAAAARLQQNGVVLDQTSFVGIEVLLGQLGSSTLTLSRSDGPFAETASGGWWLYVPSTLHFKPVMASRDCHLRLNIWGQGALGEAAKALIEIRRGETLIQQVTLSAPTEATWFDLDPMPSLEGGAKVAVSVTFANNYDAYTEIGGVLEDRNLAIEHVSLACGS